MPTAVAERVAAKAKANEAFELAAYRELVAKCGRGEEPDPDKVLLALKKWGRDPSAFQADVELYAERLALAEVVSHLEEQQQAAADAKVAIAAAEVEYAEQCRLLEEQHNARIEPLMESEKDATLALGRIEQAIAKLRATAPADRIARRDALILRRQEVDLAWNTLQSQVTKTLEEDLPRIKAQLEHTRGWHLDFPDHIFELKKREKLDEIERLQGQVDAIEGGRTEVEARLAGLRENIIELNAEIAEVEATFLEP